MESRAAARLLSRLKLPPHLTGKKPAVAPRVEGPQGAEPSAPSKETGS
jgi:hypothetical protein